MQLDWINALYGGAIIAVAVSLMLYFNGRVTGIAGIIYGLFNPVKGDVLWRVAFLLGLFVSGIIFRTQNEMLFTNLSEGVTWKPIVAGLIVGFGTVLGSGCTSGHGVCGISRLSPRSIVATVTFIAAGVFAVFIFNKLGVF